MSYSITHVVFNEKRTHATQSDKKNNILIYTKDWQLRSPTDRERMAAQCRAKLISFDLEYDSDGIIVDRLTGTPYTGCIGLFRTTSNGLLAVHTGFGDETTCVDGVILPDKIPDNSQPRVDDREDLTDDESNDFAEFVRETVEDVTAIVQDTVRSTDDDDSSDDQTSPLDELPIAAEPLSTGVQ